MYAKTFVIRWNELDANALMKKTAYLDRALDVRLAFFAEHGFLPEDFAKLKFRPVTLKDEIEYYKEIGLMEGLRVSFSLKAITPDGSQFQIQNEYFLHDGTCCARLTTIGAWLNLASKKITPPPNELYRVLHSLPKTEDFVIFERTLPIS